MDINRFDELAGRIEGVAHAVVLLAEMMERETCMDGPTLSRQWREAVPTRSGDTPLRNTARKTLQGLAQALDDARSHAQELVHQAKLADPSLLGRQASPVEHRHLDALGERLTRAERRLDRLDGTAPGHPPAPTAR